MNKVNPFSALAAPIPALTGLITPIIFLSNLFITFEAILLTIPGELSVIKRTGTFFSAFLPKLPNQGAKDPPD